MTQHDRDWLATYNAALIAHASGARDLCGGSGDADIYVEALHLLAQKQATLAHGPRDQEPTL